MASITVTVNGTRHTSDVAPRLLLVHYLRDVLGLTGTHVGCDTSQCGACTIHVNGLAVKVLHDVRGTGRRGRDTDHRRSGERRPASPASGGLLGGARAPMRLLHSGHDNDGPSNTGAKRQSHRGGDTPQPCRKPLSLHRISQHSEGHPVRRAEKLGRTRHPAFRGILRRPGASSYSRNKLQKQEVAR